MSSYDIIMWLKANMEMFSNSPAFCEENPPITYGFPSQRASSQGLDGLFVVP